MPEFIRILQARIRALLKRRQLDHDLREELRFHLLEKQAAMESAGISPEEARSAVQRRFGNATSLKELCRDAWMFRSLENSLRDARYALRVLAKNPTFTTIAVLTLAFGIGANTAIFSVIESVVFRSLPYKAPDQLFSVREALQQGADRHDLTCVNAGNFLLWGPHAGSFSGIALIEPETDNLNLKDETVQIHGVRASADLFKILGMEPQMGRFFTPDQDRSGTANSIILTNALWRNQFHSDPAIVGSTIHLNGSPFVVTGVLPESFYFPKQNELYSSTIAGWTYPIEYFVNLALQRYEINPGLQMFNFSAIGRLRLGANPKSAAEELDVGEVQASKGNAIGAKLQIDLIPLKASILGPAEHNLWMLMSGAGLVLLLVCVNLAGLLIAKGAGRVHEIGVRTSLGARRIDIVLQFLIEALLLSATGGALGLVAAYWGVRALVRAAPVEIPRLGSIGIDGEVLLFSAALSLGAGVLFSLLPAVRLTRSDSNGILRTAGPNTSSGRSVSRLHQAIAASEIALCTVLLISALLIAQSLVRVMKTNAWANVSHVVTLNFTPPANHYRQDSLRAQLVTRLLEEARNHPGVQAAGITSAMPFKGQMWGDDVQFVEAAKPEKDTPNANWRFISPGYFRAIGQPLVAGRDLLQSDSGRHLVLISERLARRLPRGTNPVGTHISWRTPNSKGDVLFEVIGVVADARATPDEPAPFTVYVPYWDWPPWGTTLVVRTASPERSVATGLQQLLRKMDKEIAIPPAETLHDILSSAVAPRRFVTMLGLLFAASATFLAALGLYGLISLSVAQRTREIGIRIAVGAQISQIFRLVISQAAVLAAIGLTVGVIGAWAATRLLRGFLYEVKPNDSVTFALVCAALLTISIAASYLPARRAMRVDPVKALKWE
ncbi:MAG TPA: ABC transporter permease [Bryobacteraceae bacterium]|nr:ABC transporter permease [Bryobacteraceae bacterium]